MSTGTEDFYRRKAPEFDEVYTRPERQDDLRDVRVRLTDWFAGKRVLELAAGSGWWTSVLADTAPPAEANSFSSKDRGPSAAISGVPMHP